MEELTGYHCRTTTYIYENYLYVRSSTRAGGTLVLKCKHSACRAVVTARRAGDVPTIVMPHNHEADASVADSARFHFAMRRVAVSNVGLSPKRVFEEVSAQFPQVAEASNYISSRNFIKGVRRGLLSRNSTNRLDTITELAGALRSNSISKRLPYPNDSVLLNVCLESIGHDPAIMLSWPESLYQISSPDSDVTQIFVIQNFKIYGVDIDDIKANLISMHSLTMCGEGDNFQGKVHMKGCVLLHDVTNQAAWIQAVSFLIPTYHGQSIMAGYDRRLRDAIRTVHPTSNVKPSYMFFTQANYEMSRKCNVNVEDTGLLRSLVCEISGLCLFSPLEVRSTLNEILLDNNLHQRYPEVYASPINALLSEVEDRWIFDLGASEVSLPADDLLIVHAQFFVEREIINMLSYVGVVHQSLSVVFNNLKRYMSTQLSAQTAPMQQLYAPMKRTAAQMLQLFNTMSRTADPASLRRQAGTFISPLLMKLHQLIRPPRRSTAPAAEASLGGNPAAGAAAGPAANFSQVSSASAAATQPVAAAAAASVSSLVNTAASPSAPAGDFTDNEVINQIASSVMNRLLQLMQNRALLERHHVEPEPGVLVAAPHQQPVPPAAPVQASVPDPTPQGPERAAPSDEEVFPWPENPFQEAPHELAPAVPEQAGPENEPPAPAEEVFVEAPAQGLDPDQAPQQQGSPQAEDEMCIVCLTTRKTTLFYPCGHYSYCAMCAMRLVRCALCRRPVIGRVLVH